LSPDETKDAARELLRLQRGLTGNRALAGAPYMDEPRLLGAYLLYYWPVSYLQVAVALQELGSRPRRVLDLGSGPGPASAALLDAGAEELCLVDCSPKALEMAAALLVGRGSSASTRRPRNLELVNLDLTKEEPPQSGPFDLIVMSHCLNELWIGIPPEEGLARRVRLVERALKSLSPEGSFLLVEPALQATNRASLDLRDTLASRGVGIDGPCVGAYSCPIRAADPQRVCHSEAPWEPPSHVASLSDAAGLDRSSVKMTWFSFSLRERKPGLEAPGPLRVVSDPMLNKTGRIRYILCGRDGLCSLSVAKNDRSIASDILKTLFRGDIVEIEGIETRGYSKYGLGADTLIRILSKAPIIY
jgi:SAM-dependent methyltransferase